MKAWIVTTYDTEGYIENIEVAITAMDAYSYCRDYISHLNFDSEYDNEMCLNELAHSYSENRNKFGVEGIIDVISKPAIQTKLSF